MMHPWPVMANDSAPPTRHVTTTRIVAVRGKKLEFRGDRVVGEEPLEIRAAGPGQDPVAVAVTMRTPGNEDELAVGFLKTEGLIDGPEIVRIEAGDPADMNQPDDRVTVRLARAFDASVVAERHFVATASCGICGKASLDEVALRAEPIPGGSPVVSRTILLALPDALRATQAAFDETGGLHASALFTPRGELLVVREDVGRHNALDKAIGQAARSGADLGAAIAILSGRAGYDLVVKALRVRIPIVVSVSAPSSLAFDLCEGAGATLVGFARGDRLQVYTGAGRIVP
jgi:FdhD protein